MAIGFASMGAGNGTETNAAALKLTCPAIVNAGDILIAHVIHLNTTTEPSTPEGWTKLYPTSGAAYLGSEEPYEGRAWVFGKIAAGTEDLTEINFGTAGGTSGRYGRIYRYSGREDEGTITQLVSGFSNKGHETDPQMPTVTTTRTGALAVALVSQDDNNTIGSATGETGGDWTQQGEAWVSTTIGAQGCMCQMQACIPTANPGTVEGGEAATQNDECNVIGFEIRPFASQRFSLTVATETDAAVALTIPIARKVTAATETDEAETLTLAPKGQTKGIEPASETDAAEAVKAAKGRAVTPASETDEGQALSASKPIHKTASPASEADSAEALTATKPIKLTAAPAAETDEARPLKVEGGSQELRPDEDLETTGWTEVPLWEKLKDDNDASYVKAMLG